MAPTKKKSPKAKNLSSTNPLTGKKANTFTKVTNAELSPPVAKQPLGRQTKRQKTETEYLQGQWDEKVESPNSSVDAPLGYRFVEPEHMPSFMEGTLKSGAGGTVSPRLVGWLAGAHHSFTPPTEGPAINEPHALAEHDIPMRRAEDLSGVELAHGTKTLERAGVPGKDPIKAMESVQMRNTLRVLSEHAAAGTSESATQKFYGGEVKTQIPDENLAKMHEDVALSSQRRFSQGAENIKEHPVFAERHKNLTEAEKVQLSRTKLASATADTSPNSKYRQGSKFPNLSQAEESTIAGMEGRPPKFIAGRPQFHTKAAVNTEILSAQGASAIRDFTETPKTGPFRGALIKHDSPDSFTVTDIHEGSQMMPHLSTTKGAVYEKTNRAGVRTTELIHPGMEIPKGMKPSMETTPSGKLKPKKGNSRVEAAISAGAGVLHKINDYNTRKVNAALGVSRGVNYSDNVNEMQAARWGSQQVSRPDVQVSSADHYPVIRDWQAEGVALPRSEKTSKLGSQWDWMFEQKHTSPQFSTNPNTSASEGNPLRKKPYMKMPGE